MENKRRRFEALAMPHLDAATNLARWLTALPPNILDAPAYKRAIAELAREHGLHFKWLDEQALRRAGA